MALLVSLRGLKACFFVYIGGVEDAKGNPLRVGYIYIYMGVEFFGIFTILPTVMANTRKHDWDALESEFLRANVSLKDYARRKSISYRYLGNRAAKDNWLLKRDELQRKAREEVRDEIIKRAEDNSETALICDTKDKVITRSKAVGDKLYTLFQAAVVAMQQGDMKEMRIAIEAWVRLDDQLRKIHGIEEAKDKPLVNINVLAALPSKDQMKRVAAEVVQEQTVVPA